MNNRLRVEKGVMGKINLGHSGALLHTVDGFTVGFCLINICFLPRLSTRGRELFPHVYDAQHRYTVGVSIVIMIAECC